MKKRFLILPFFILALILVLTLLPISFLNADTVNLVQNGDFSNGGNHWITGGANVSFTDTPGEVLIGPAEFALIVQVIETSRKDLKMSFDIYPTIYVDTSFVAGINLYKDGIGYLNSADYVYTEAAFPLTEWTTESFYISDLWHDYFGIDLPDFDYIEIWVESTDGDVAYFDNIKLTYEEAAAVAPVWVRDSEMKCKQVWINEDNKFQFSFIYPYKDNNWVRIYDMTGKLVYEIDMPYDNPNIIVDLPDGMYTVKTFNDQPEPIQTFIIGKP